MSLRNNQNQGKPTGGGNPSKALKQIKRVEGLILKDTDIGYVGPHSIGTIFFSDEKSGEIAQDPSSLPYAIPRNRNNITYPVIGEFVIITQGPAPDYYPDLGGSPLSKINYYSDPISVYGNGSNNAVPNQTNAEDHQLGTYFKENVNLSPLKPGEGDTIMEGKNGQRIRFTTTGPDGTNSISRNATNDPNDGNPSIGQRAIIISLGSGRSENITADNASIYMFENHSIPLDVASTNVDSLNTTYTPIKDPLDAATAPPEEVIPEPIAEPPQVTEIDFTPDPEGDNTVEEITTSPPPTNDDPFSDPVFDSLDESVDEGLLTEVESVFDISYGEDISEDINSSDSDINFSIDTQNYTNDPDWQNLQTDQNIYINPNASLGSRGITLANCIKSARAKKDNILNFPGADVVADGNSYSAQKIMHNLNNVITYCIDPLTIQFPNLRISSGLRVTELNEAIGGSKTSEHRLGRAIDFQVDGVPTYEIFNYIVNQGIPYNQLVWEYPEKDKKSWIHISYNHSNNNFNKTIACKNTTLKSSLEKNYEGKIKFSGDYARYIKIDNVPDHKTLT